MVGSLVFVFRGLEMVINRYDNSIIFFIVMLVIFLNNFYWFFLKVEKLIFSSCVGYKCLECIYFIVLNVEKVIIELIVLIKIVLNGKKVLLINVIGNRDKNMI